MRRIILIMICMATLTACGGAKKEKQQALPKVYMTTEITPEGLMRVYQALGVKAEGNVAVKISTGEPGGKNYLKPALIGQLVQAVEGTIVECNTAYRGRRFSSEEHLKAAREHGFFEIANVDIMDADGEIKIPVQDTTHLKYNLVGENIKKYDFMINLAHFKGHAMGGFGGVLKNQSIGVASRNGKAYIHSVGNTEDPNEMWGFTGDQIGFLESMAAAAQSVHEYFGEGNILYINVMNNMSIDCDCSFHPADPLLKDVGILASTDPVALDQACLDIIFNITPEEGNDNGPLLERIKALHGTHIVDYAASIGLGSKEYELVDIDCRQMKQAVETTLSSYPAATLQDVYKSMFQDRFGVAHMLNDHKAVRTYIEEELAACEGACSNYYEPCGWRGDYIRVDLRAVRDGVISLDDLTRSFVRSAQYATTADSTALADWQREWYRIMDSCHEQLANLKGFDEDSTKIAAMLAQGMYVVHHSPQFAEAYHPHYRIVHRTELP